MQKRCNLNAILFCKKHVLLNELCFYNLKDVTRLLASVFLTTVTFPLSAAHIIERFSDSVFRGVPLMTRVSRRPEMSALIKKKEKKKKKMSLFAFSDSRFATGAVPFLKTSDRTQ